MSRMSTSQLLSLVEEKGKTAVEALDALMSSFIDVRGRVPAQLEDRVLESVLEADIEFVDGNPGYGPCVKCGCTDELRMGWCFDCVFGGCPDDLMESEINRFIEARACWTAKFTAEDHKSCSWCQMNEAVRPSSTDPTRAFLTLCKECRESNMTSIQKHGRTARFKGEGEGFIPQDLHDTVHLKDGSSGKIDQVIDFEHSVVMFPDGSYKVISFSDIEKFADVGV